MTSPKMNTDIRQPPSRGFMDDLTIITSTHVQARWILNALEETATWARMTFKPKKSRSLVIKKGKVTQQFHLKVQGEVIPTIVGNPIKCLGKWYDDSLNDRKNVSRIKQQVEEGMRNIDKTGLPGQFKTWIYQHGLLPRLTWPLMLYEISASVVEKLEKIVSKHLRKWLGVPPCFTSVGLYIKTAKLQLPITSLVEEYKVSKARLVMTLKNSKDEKVRKAGVEVRTGRKWSASLAVQEAESSLRHKDIVGAVYQGRQGFGSSKIQFWEKASVAEKRSMVQLEIRAKEEETRKAKSVALSSQGAWNRWETENRQLKWHEIWKYPHQQLQFLLRSVYDVLPSPSNLHTWGLVESPDCPLCSKRGTLDHILSSCGVALSQGRYTWRHDQILKVLADALDQEKKAVSRRRVKKKTVINFVKEGEVVKKSHPSDRYGLLDKPSDWKSEVDLDGRLLFPEIVPTTLRPDMVLWSRETKMLIIIELTVHWEERCNEAHERKLSRYEDLLAECRKQGWKTWNFPVEEDFLHKQCGGCSVL